MSRSRKSLPICGLTLVESEKQDKQAWHRRMRRRERQRLGIVPPVEADDYLTTAVREISDPWLFAKDGKQYVSNVEEAREIVRK